MFDDRLTVITTFLGEGLHTMPLSCMRDAREMTAQKKPNPVVLGNSLKHNISAKGFFSHGESVTWNY
ncbi:hypothetical protein TWF217_005390 [Orbilia oligospora]|nr:hypothetical protein TWF217_005390 [Orbilia oligospora]